MAGFRGFQLMDINKTAVFQIIWFHSKILDDAHGFLPAGATTETIKASFEGDNL